MGKKDTDKGIRGYTDSRGGWHPTWEKAIRANMAYEDHPCYSERAFEKAVSEARAEDKELSPDC